MNSHRTRIRTGVAALAVALALPAAAGAATPKVGSFDGPIGKGSQNASMSIGVYSKSEISSIGVVWACGGKGAADHLTNVVIDPDGKDWVKISGGRFSVTRKAATRVGDVFDPASQRDAGKAKVTVTGTFVTPKKITGTVSAKLGGCSISSKYTSTLK